MTNAESPVPRPTNLPLVEALLHVASLISSELNPQRLRRAIVQTITDAIPDIDAALLWLYSETDEVVYLAAMQRPGWSGAELPPASATFTVQPGERRVGRALVSGQIETIVDRERFVNSLRVAVDRPLPMLEALVDDIGPLCAVTTLPLRFGNQWIGVLELVNVSGQPAMQPEEHTIFLAFATQVATMLRNAQLYERLAEQNKHLQALDAVVSVISASESLQELLQRVLQVVLRACGMEQGAIVFPDASSAALLPQVVQNLDSATLDGVLRATDGVLHEVLRTGQIAIVSLGAAGRTETDGMVVLPLPAGGSVTGVLLLCGAMSALQTATWGWLTAIGAQIGFAVANGQLYMATNSDRRRLGAVISSIADGVMICNTAGEIVIVNRAATTLLDGTIREGMTIEALAQAQGMRDIYQVDLPASRTPLGRALSGEVFHDFEVVVRKHEGRDRVLSTSGAPLLGEHGDNDGAVVVFRDVTQHKEHDAARDEFLAIAAHELRSPLAAIKGYSDLLVRRELARPEATERDIRGSGMLSRQVDHLVMLIDNLLDMSRIDAGRLQLNLQPTDLMALVDACVDRLRTSDERHEWEVAGPAMLIITADATRIQQVITNLLVNAGRYSPPQTRVVTEVSIAPDENRGPWVVLTVRDEGPGVPFEDQERIFERYFRSSTTQATSGLGLGLYLSREIVVRHGGQLRVESVPGLGATFIVEMPISGPDASSAV
ncbi:MAG: ATP-binding protein [Herpetosiphon sp.]